MCREVLHNHRAEGSKKTCPKLVWYITQERQAGSLPQPAASRIKFSFLLSLGVLIILPARQQRKRCVKSVCVVVMHVSLWDYKQSQSMPVDHHRSEMNAAQQQGSLHSPPYASAAIRSRAAWRCRKKSSFVAKEKSLPSPMTLCLKRKFHACKGKRSAWGRAVKSQIVKLLLCRLFRGCSLSTAGGCGVSRIKSG